LNSPCWRRFV